MGNLKVLGGLGVLCLLGLHDTRHLLELTFRVVQQVALRKKLTETIKKLRVLRRKTLKPWQVSSCFIELLERQLGGHPYEKLLPILRVRLCRFSQVRQCPGVTFLRE